MMGADTADADLIFDEIERSLREIAEALVADRRAFESAVGQFRRVNDGLEEMVRRYRDLSDRLVIVEGLIDHAEHERGRGA